MCRYHNPIMQTILLGSALLVSCFLTSGVAGLNIIPQAHSLTLPIAAGEERCVVAHAKGPQDRLLFHYQVRAGPEDFKAVILRPDGLKLWQAEADEHYTEQKVFFEAKTAGEFQFCFDNDAGSETLVMISVASLSKRRAHKKVDPIIKVLSKAQASLLGLQQDQEYMRSREREHRETLESNNTRVVVRGLVELIVMLGMSVGQVYMLRRLFKPKSTRAA